MLIWFSVFFIDFFVKKIISYPFYLIIINISQIIIKHEIVLKIVLLELGKIKEQYLGKKILTQSSKTGDANSVAGKIWQRRTPMKQSNNGGDSHMAGEISRV